jgi:ATP-binding cassette subfamily C protein
MSTLLPVADGRTTWAATRRLLRPHRGRLLLTAIVMLAAATAALAVPALLGRIVQIATEGGPVAAVAWAVGGIVAACVAGAALDAVGRSLMARVTEASLAVLREDVVEQVLHLPVAEVEAAGEGDVVSRVSGDVETVGETAAGVLPAVTSAAFSVVVTLAGLGALDWRFALGALAALPLQLLSLRAFRRRTPPVYAAARRAEGERAEALLQAVHGAPTALALHRADDQRAAVERTSRAAIATEMRGVRYVGRFANGSNLAELCGMAGVLVVGYLLVTSGAVGVGAATAAALFFHRLFGPMGVLLFQADDLALAGAGLARLVGVTEAAGSAGATGSAGSTGRGSIDRGAGTPADDRTAAADRTGTTPLPIEVRGTHFAYRTDRPVLTDVTLHLAAGERVALVGTSGAGKSTLARLVTGTLDPTAGAVLVDGRPAAEVHTDHPGRVVLVDQDVHTFAGPLADDLRLADPAADDATLTRALDTAGAGWWADLPDGLATVLGPDGTTLRPDQAQQLALARVLLADPPVVVLDEATADLPRSRQTALDAALDGVLAGRTALLVAHRLDQAVRADRIVVMAEGRVVQDGPPEALIAAEGPFRVLWTAWSGERTAAADPV